MSTANSENLSLMHSINLHNLDVLETFTGFLVADPFEGLARLFINSFVADGIARNEVYQSCDKSGGFVFLDALIAETKDPKVIRDQLVNILLAGRDTTACLLSWTL